MDDRNRLIKHSGQVFTPSFLVKNILDFSSYSGERILRKHVIDNSCGDGAFLCEIVDRYCTQYQSRKDDKTGLREELEQYVHGIEIDSEAYGNCLYNLDCIASGYGISGVNWDVVHENALKVSKYDDKMDYVVGNPPYVRVHNLENDYEDVKKFCFAQDGMTDLYLVFYELGFNMLNDRGKLCYITPSSWLASIAATNMRNYIMRERTLSSLIDLGHFQPFSDATTYTMIALFDKACRHDQIDYYSYSEQNHKEEFICKIPYKDICIDNNFYIAPPYELSLLRDIKTKKVRKYCSVKNGFATLADKVFILDVTFSELTIPVLKASTGKWHTGFFPYDENGKPLPREQIFSHSNVAHYLIDKKEILLKGKDEKSHPQWYLYGRTQALRDVFEEKYAINTMLRDVRSIRLERVPYGSGLYSGLYILTKAPFNLIESIIKSDKFIGYIKILKKYKSGGYYTFNSQDLEQYINYLLDQKNYTEPKARTYDKRRVSECDLTLF